MLELVAHNLPDPIKNIAKTVRRPIRRLIEVAQRRSSAARDSHPSALQCIVAANDLGLYCVPRSSLHRAAAQTILAGHVWERETIDFMRQNCGTGDIVHAGAYFGDFLPALAAGAGEGARVWAFEPNNENHRCASVTLELNPFSQRVKLFHAALGPVVGSVMMSVEDALGQSLGGWSHVSSTGKECTRQLTLDGLVPGGRRVSALHLDVEGYEESALRGAELTIRREKPILILETVPASDWFRNLLGDCDYVMEGQVAGNTIFRSQKAERR